MILEYIHAMNFIYVSIMKCHAELAMVFAYIVVFVSIVLVVSGTNTVDGFCLVVLWVVSVFGGKMRACQG